MEIKLYSIKWNEKKQAFGLSAALSMKNHLE